MWNCNLGGVWIRMKLCFASAFFSLSLFFFFKLWLLTFLHEQCSRALLQDPQTPLFSNFFIKNGSHGTIHTFKIYFTIIFSIFNCIQTDINKEAEVLDALSVVLLMINNTPNLTLEPLLNDCRNLVWEIPTSR